ncbi:hypothetical protein Drose_10390 [Dactylosporangium roseum]|uniref:Uncharacterized protein n=1 Tax=Dactylosporangium roseum TaxID=47989 RepID=A0ABY5Z968_9ACTN|nr:hypothetical protein [Dactylosporangium roseum]UWZ38604.1 hypothetical protein Drose_10390 [Dactylosporangium roseum]
MFPFAMIVSQSAMAEKFPGTRSGAEGFLFRSALPHAPVVPHPEPAPKAYHTRAIVASALRRAATAIAPPARDCSHAR